jgi:hydrogenase/urease accessory protein HupE
MSLRIARLLLLLSLALVGAAADAHEMSMAEMQVREFSTGEYQWRWSASERKDPARALSPVWPAGCVAEGDLLHCGPAGLRGAMSIRGVGDAYSAVLMKIYWRDGDARAYTITAGQPTVQLYGSSEDRRGLGEVASAYLVLGIEHILSGFDHLLFVIGLLFLVGFERRLVWTITAFTAAHSVTLASAALGWLTLRPAPVEACIALSIVLVAGEALRERATLARRLPALVAFIFGLVHGLGFAGALKEIGLPENHLATALLSFNIGVEAGQLLVVGAAFVLVRAASRWPAMQWARRPALYAVGSVAAYWTIARVAVLAG